MDEQEFDSLLPWGRYQRPDMHKAGRLITLGLALWGRTSDDLRQRLLAPTPNVPAGCSLADLEQLQRQAEQILGYYLARVSIHPTTLGSLHPQETIAIGAQRFNLLEARCEIARRAVRHLRGQP